MKKRILLILVVLLLIPICTGCSSEKPEDIKYSIHIACSGDYIAKSPENMVKDSTHIFEGVVVDISAQVFNNKTGNPQFLPIGEADPKDYSALTVYTVLITQPHKGMSGVLEYVISEDGNWYPMGPARKQALERVGIDPKERLTAYPTFTNLEKGESYLFCTTRLDSGYMIPHGGYLVLKEKWEYTAKVRAMLPWLPSPLLIVGVISAAAVVTVLIIRKKKKKTAPEETEPIPEET